MSSIPESGANPPTFPSYDPPPIVQARDDDKRPKNVEQFLDLFAHMSDPPPPGTIETDGTNQLDGTAN